MSIYHSEKCKKYEIQLAAKLPYFEGIFDLWIHEQQELPFLQANVHQFCKPKSVCSMRETRRPWNEFRFPRIFLCCMRSIEFKNSLLCLKWWRAQNYSICGNKFMSKSLRTFWKMIYEEIDVQRCHLKIRRQEA